MSNIPFPKDLQQNSDAIEASSKEPGRQTIRSYKTAECQQFTNFDSTDTANHRQSEQGYDNNVHCFQNINPEHTNKSWKRPIVYTPQESMTPEQNNVMVDDGMHENVTHGSVQSRSSIQNSVDLERSTEVNYERNVENAPSHSDTTYYENDNSITTHTQSLPTNKPVSSKIGNKKGVSLNIIPPKRKYKKIFTSNTEDNRVKAEKMDLSVTLSAGEYHQYPSPNDSNIKVKSRPNPPKNVDIGISNTGQSQTLQSLNVGSRQEQENENETRQRSPETVLCLDISENMKDRAFSEMIQTAKAIVTGIQVFALENEMPPEKIAIATFGHETKVIMHLTEDYEGLITKIDNLKPGGSSDMKNGLMMAQAAFSSSCQILCSKIILISNSQTGDATQPEHTKGTAQASLINTWPSLPEMMQQRIRVYCIPVGEARLEIFEELSKATGGKIILQNQIQKVVKLTRSVYLGYELAANFDDTVSREQRKGILINFGYGSSEDDLDNILDEIEFINDKVVEQDNPRRRYDEFDPYMPESGTRVRRGPHWRKGNQDTECVGTVIGHHKKGVLFVEWDNGTRDRCNYTQIQQEVDVVNEPRTLSRDEMIAVGCIVKRGINWNHGDFDGGPGNVGVVLRVVDDGTVLVRWRDKDKHRYKFGYDGIFEVAVCTHSQAAEVQPTALPPRDRASNNFQLFNLDNVQLPLTRNTRMPVHSTTSETEKVEVTWQYQTQKDAVEWIAYEPNVQEKIEMAYKKNRKTQLITIDDERFRVVFSDMTLVSITSKKKVKTRRHQTPIRR